MPDKVTRQITPVYETVPCPWSPAHPRHDHQLIFPLDVSCSAGADVSCSAKAGVDRLLLVWSEYYINRPSYTSRAPYDERGSTGDHMPCRISGRLPG